MRPVRIGLVGFGYWARLSYLPLLEELSDVTVVGACAKTEGSRDAARQMLGEGVAIHDDYAGLIRPDCADAVIIGLPPDLNAAAAARGSRGRPARICRAPVHRSRRHREDAPSG